MPNKTYFIIVFMSTDLSVVILSMDSLCSVATFTNKLLAARGSILLLLVA